VFSRFSRLLKAEPHGTGAFDSTGSPASCQAFHPPTNARAFSQPAFCKSRATQGASWLRCVRYKRKQPRLLRHFQFREPPHGARLTQSARACHRELKRASSRAGRAGVHEMGPAAQTGLRPRHARPQQGRNSYLTQLRLTGSAHWRYTSAQKKRWFKIPIHSNRVDDERRCDAGVRTMVSICSIPNDSAATTCSRGCGRIGSD